MELKHMSEMSEFQKEVVSALESLSYEYRFNKIYQHGNGELINVDKIKSLRDLIRVIYQSGAQEKVWEIKRVLEIQS